jgi:hypothetical protein
MVQAILQPSPYILMRSVTAFTREAQAPPSAGQMLQALASTLGSHKELTLVSWYRGCCGVDRCALLAKPQGARGNNPAVLGNHKELTLVS